MKECDLTLRGTILGLVTALLMAMTCTYLGLKVGRTTSMSLPLAVIIMLILRKCNGSGVKENVIAQTVAAAGESMASGALFTLPALVISGYWSRFNYLHVSLISSLGCILGVIITVPLRKLMIEQMCLKYPGGVASALLMQSTKLLDGAARKHMVVGLSLGSISSLLHSGLKIIQDKLSFWYIKGNLAIGGAISLDLTMFAIGLLTGKEVAKSMMIGVILRGIIITHYGWVNGVGGEHLLLASVSDSLRLVAVGTMVIAGVVNIYQVIKMLWHSSTARHINHNTSKDNIDIPLWLIVFAALSLAVIVFFAIKTSLISGIMSTMAVLTLITICMMILIVCATVGSRIVGDSLILPVSGITIMGIFLCSIAIFALTPHQLLKMHGAALGTFVLLHASVIATTTIIGADNMQDMKAGNILGVTPWKQQAALLIGGIAASFTLPAIFNLLFDSYGIAGVVPRSDMNVNTTLQAPQASLMAVVVKLIFIDNAMPMGYLSIGVLIAIAMYASNRFLGMRVQPLNFALGIYLPIEGVIPIIIGGIIKDRLFGSKDDLGINDNNVMLTGGIIAGASITAVIIAIVIVLCGDIISPPESIVMGWVGVICSLLLILITCVYAHKFTS